MWAVSDSHWDESIYSQSFGTMVQISKICKEASSLAEVSYLVTWSKIFMVPRSKVWSDVL